MSRLPRPLHAGAWWLWAGGLGAAAAQTTNPLLLGAVIAVATLVVTARRSGAPWAGGYRAYLLVALVVIAIRVVFRIALGGDYGSHTLVTLPSIPLPQWAGGIALGGEVTTEEVLAGLYDGLRLATLVICVGAANTLADPRRLLSSLPRALGGVSAAVVVALSLAPQLVESVMRVRKARHLRGETGMGLRSIRSLLVPVMEDAVGRSLSLAASMESRGYGRNEGRVPVPATGAAWLGMATLLVGTFIVLSGPGGAALPVALMIGGCLLAASGLLEAGRRAQRTRYRPDPWRGPEWSVALAGVVAAGGVFVAGLITTQDLHPSLQPLAWPSMSAMGTLALILAVTPAWTAPPIEAPSGARIRLLDEAAS